MYSHVSQTNITSVRPIHAHITHCTLTLDLLILVGGVTLTSTCSTLAVRRWTHTGERETVLKHHLQ